LDHVPKIKQPFNSIFRERKGFPEVLAKPEYYVFADHCRPSEFELLAALSAQ
jgi:hypothetical protein